MADCFSNKDGEEIREQVREDYAAAAECGCCLCATTAYDEMDTSFIPAEVMAHNQGCSSPLTDAKEYINAGDTVLDLGCGAGLDVFLAAKIVGASGKAIGIDMTEEMIDVAIRNADEICENLALETPNTVFIKSIIEALPLGDASVDLVISNCVINLSGDKTAVFSEIFRVLKPGGRFIISDVFASAAVPEHMRTDRELISRCIGGAMEERLFLEIAASCGFLNIGALHTDQYETVEGIDFVSKTVSATKP
jgi:ubiquinone/menaquinone biosynthesis C-methylase UbiE